MAEAAATGKVPTLQEIPLDAIKDAIERAINEVSVRVSRRNHRGQLQILVSTWGMPTEELPLLPGKLQQMAGGGEYIIDCFNTMNPLEKVLQSFMIRIEGAARPADTQMLSGQMQQPAGMSSGGPMMNPFAPQHGQAMIPGLLTPQGAQGPLPLAGVPGFPAQFAMMGQHPQAQGWVAGLAPQYQQGYLDQQYGGQLPPGASVPSDQMALKQVKDMKDEVASARAAEAVAEEKLEAERKKHAEESAKWAARLDKIEKDAAEARHTADLKQLQASFEAKIDKLLAAQAAQAAAAQAAPKSTGISEYTPLIVALAPLGLAFMQSGKEQQSQMLQSVLALSAPKKGDSSSLEMVKALAPLAAPMLIKYMDGRGPDAMSRAHEAIADSNMQQMAMMAQFVSQMAASQGESSPWLPFIQQGVEGVMNIVGAYMEKKGQAPPVPMMIHQGRAQHLPSPAAPEQQYAQGGATVTPPEDMPETPEAVLNLIMMSPRVPQDFKTQEWYDILLALHQEAPVDTVAGALVGHLGHLMQNDALPVVLNGIFTDTERLCSGLLRGMPIYQKAPEYTDNVIAAMISLLDAARQASEASEASEEEDSEAAPAPAPRARGPKTSPIVTPAPAAAE